MTESDPGCVKTLEAIVGAQQKNRSHGLDESFMRGRPSLCTNLVPERPIEWFSHSQDPSRTSVALGKLMTNLIPCNPGAIADEEDEHDQPSCSALEFGAASDPMAADSRRPTNDTGWQSI